MSLRPTSRSAERLSFDEYVALRWTALYRTAYLLTASGADAEDLAGATLVKACGAWSRIAGASSPEAEVRRFVGSALPSSLATQSPDEDDRGSVWATIAALPPVQRAVLVLRFYEDLADREIADVLGLSARTMRSTASAAIDAVRARAGAPDVDQLLTDELREIADAVDVPPPPGVPDLASRARHEVRRTRARAVAIAGGVAGVAVAAIVIGSQISGSDAPTHPKSTGLRTGEPSHLPFLEGTHLYVGGQLQPGRWQQVISTGDTSIALLDAAAPRRQTLIVFRDDVEVVRVTGIAAYQVMVSTDGNKAAYVVLGGTDAHLVVLDTVARVELGRIAVSRSLLGHLGKENEAWEGIQGVADDGTVTYGGVLVTHVWNPGSPPVNHKASFDAFPPPGFPGNADSIVVSPDGGWGSWLTDPYAAPQAVDTSFGVPAGLTFQRPGKPETRATIALPHDGSPVRVAWEATTKVLVTVFHDPGGQSIELLRCSVVDKTCEYAPVPTGQ